MESAYPPDLTAWLVNGFKSGFDICYDGPVNRTSTANNLPFNVGNRVILWNKLMKEVKLGRVAGPFDSPPYSQFVQSPIGLVPKDNGRET